MSMKHVEIAKNLFLVQKEVEIKNKVTVKEPTNHIWEYDRSGSMSWVIRDLAEDLIKQSKTLPVGDTLTLGWFSSENGEYNFIVKGYKITEARDYTVIEKAIRQNASTIGMTCFSEILANTEQVIKDLSVYSKNFSFMFFTDGYPVVSNYQNEVRKIHAAIESIKGLITSSLLVGYSHYYNKPLMTEMAAKMGGGLIHSENLAAFNVALSNFLGDTSGAGKKLGVELPECEKLAVFSLNGKQINLYEENESKISFSPSGKDHDYIYFLAKTDVKALKDSVGVSFTDANVKGSAKPVEPIVKAAYAAAYVLTQATKTDKALEVLSVLGEKALIDAVCNSFTNSDYGKAEEKIRDACFDADKRFLQGRNTKYLPAADAFCLLDVLNILMNDDDAKFYPYSDLFTYSRIGVGSKTKDENLFPKFNADKTSACNFGTLTWNDKKLNLSVLAMIKGTVNLRGDYKAVNLPEVYTTHIWRNYSLVKDGFLNMKTIPVSLSENSFITLKEKGLLDSNASFKAGEIYVLDLGAVPVINRSIADGKTSAKELCKKCFEEVKLEAKIKAYKFYKDEIENKGIKTANFNLTPEQEALLLTNGVGKNGYSPPTEKLDATDFYYAKEFQIKIKDYSSLPSVKDVLKTVTEGKKITASKALVKAGVDEVDNSTKDLTDKAKLEVLEGMIKIEKVKLNAVRSEIQKVKFAILLGKRWFDEFSDRSANTVDVDGNNFTIEVREVKVEV